jgi:hypothetical protein
MTEAEWLACSELEPILAFLKDKASQRKVRLYFSAGCRAIWPLIVLRVSQAAVEVGERFADCLATPRELFVASHDAEVDCLWPWYDELADSFKWDAAYLAWYTARIRLLITKPEYEREPFGFDRMTTHTLSLTRNVSWPGRWLIHDIFGNPFRPVTLDPSWLTSTVLTLANGIYSEKAFDRMPILADALQDAGCDNEDMLNHCRQPGKHVRGCWCVDLLLYEQ